MQSMHGSRWLSVIVMCTCVGLFNVYVGTFALEQNCSTSAAPKEWFSPLNGEHGLIDYNTSSPAGWGACSRFSRATCCEKNQTDSVTRILILMERAAFSDSCKAVTEKALCPLACDPDVGLGRLPPVLCLDTCTEWFEACKGDFFSPIAVGVQRMPLPCAESALVCSKMGDMYSTGSDMCEAMSVKWGTDKCLTGEVDATRRGKVRTPIGNRSKPSGGMPGLVEMFWRDMRHLQRFFDKFFGNFITTYTKSVDRILTKYGSYITWSVPLILVGFVYLVQRRMKKAAENNDDFR